MNKKSYKGKSRRKMCATDNEAVNRAIQNDEKEMSSDEVIRELDILFKEFKASDELDNIFDEEEADDHLLNDDEDEVLDEVLNLVGSGQSGFKHVPEELRPTDGFLLYIQIYLKVFDPELEGDLFDFQQLFTIHRTRRDAPDFVRKKMDDYFELLGCNPELAVSSLILSQHALNVSILKRFELEEKKNFHAVCQNIKFDYSQELEGSNIKLEQYLQKTPDTGHAWFDMLGLKTHLLGVEDQPQRQFLKKIINQAATKKKLVIETESVFDELEDRFPNFAEVVKFYRAQFRLAAVTGRSRITPILLLGPAGIGKTMFCKALAKALETGFTFIDMASATSAWVLTGLHASWHGGKAGKIFDTMVSSPTLSPIVVLDEIEKPVKPETDPKNALYQLLEESGSKSFVDEFVNFPCDLSSVIYIACANGLEGLTAPLLSRFKVFDIPAPSRDEQAIILQRMYQEETGQSPLFESELDRAVVSMLMSDSLRVAKQDISDAVGMALLEHSPSDIKLMVAQGTVNIAVRPRHFKNHHMEKAALKIGF